VPRDDARLAELQAQARTDAAASLALEAEQNQITSARLARRARTGTLAIMLIAASAAFVGCAKWRIALGPRRPAAPPGPMRKAIKLRKLQDALIRYRVTDACTGCTLCAQVCKTGAIAYRPYEKHDIDDSRCTWCDKCFGLPGGRGRGRVGRQRRRRRAHSTARWPRDRGLLAIPGSNTGLR
jgi:NADH-quinone oxidoreductase subunit F